MAQGDSIQKRLGKVRPPRVQMTYEVEVGDAREQKELPFVVGVMGDFGGNPDARRRLKERSFVGVDNANFDEVLAGVGPALQFQVPNKLGGEGELAVKLQFSAMRDFRPEAVARQVEPLARLLDARSKLADLRNKLAGNDRLEDLLADVLRNTEELASLAPKGD